MVAADERRGGQPCWPSGHDPSCSSCSSPRYSTALWVSRVSKFR